MELILKRFESYLITFIAGFSILVTEIAAGRILAPFLGVSLYTWTSIIGVMLTGISAGAYLGGRCADRWPTKKTLGWILLCAGVASLSVSPVTNVIAPSDLRVPLMARILVVAAATFLVPTVLLGMIAPVLARLSMQDLGEAGHTVGSLYAVSTVGSIVGTLLTGFLLISMIGTHNLFLAVGLGLVATALLVCPPFRSRKPALAFLLLPPVLYLGVYDLAFRPTFKEDVYLFKETDYFTIKLVETESHDTGRRLEGLVLDNLLHSYVDLDDPLYLEYPYEKIYADILRWRFREDGEVNALTIGGGAYTLPRYMEALYPYASHDVVEIDPQVTEVAYNYLGLPRDTDIRTFTTDGRWFVKHCTKRYDVVFVDVFNDLSLPYHLTTKEFAHELRRLLTSEGIMVTNLVDDFSKGRFLPSYVKTLREVFGSSRVRVLAMQPDPGGVGIGTFVVLASTADLDMADFEAHLAKVGARTAFPVSPDAMDALARNERAVVLTDDYAPVDNLIAPVFGERFGPDRR